MNIHLKLELQLFYKETENVNYCSSPVLFPSIEGRGNTPEEAKEDWQRKIIENRERLFDKAKKQLEPQIILKEFELNEI
jgi:hypothetical protein